MYKAPITRYISEAWLFKSFSSLELPVNSTVPLTLSSHTRRDLLKLPKSVVWPEDVSLGAISRVLGVSASLFSVDFIANIIDFPLFFIMSQSQAHLYLSQRILLVLTTGGFTHAGKTGHEMWTYWQLNRNYTAPNLGNWPGARGMWPRNRICNTRGTRELGGIRVWLRQQASSVRPRVCYDGWRGRAPGHWSSTFLRAMQCRCQPCSCSS